MPTLVVDQKDHYLHYEDTGVPAQPAEKPYTTFIVVHGTSFHSVVFKRLLPLAPSHNIRLVLLNRRDYPGSSSYTEAELDGVKTGTEAAQIEFGKARAVEFATFIQKFVEKEDVPKMTDDGKDGGVVMMSWSSGTMYVLPVLAHADAIPENIRKAIEPYFRKYIIFDTARYGFGFGTSAEGSNFLVHPSVTEEESKRSFNDWVAAYYIHKSTTSRNDADLQAVATADSHPSTLKRMTQEELLEMTSPEAIEHSEIPARTAKAEIFAERTRRALFDDEMAANYLPRCTVDAIYCEHSMWAMINAAWGLQKLREKADEEGVTGRPFRVHIMPKTNHFPHWDYPEDAMKFFVDVMKS